MSARNTPLRPTPKSHWTTTGSGDVRMRAATLAASNDMVPGVGYVDSWFQPCSCKNSSWRGRVEPRRDRTMFTVENPLPCLLTPSFMVMMPCVTDVCFEVGK